jgi:Tol biopolymer transport system component
MSPDESEVAVLSDTGGHANVWIARIADGAMRPLTREFDQNVVVAVPGWSPRGDWINYLSNRGSRTGAVLLWLVRPDGSDARSLGLEGAWACWSGDGAWLYYSVAVESGVHHLRKVRAEGGSPVTVRDDDAISCEVTPDGSAMYYARILREAGGGWDLEIRVARPETGPSSPLARVAASRVPAHGSNFQPYLSPDGQWLAMPLIDGSITNLWALSTTTGAWRQLTDFGRRNVTIVRRIAWSRDGTHIYASAGDVDADIVVLAGLR